MQRVLFLGPTFFKPGIWSTLARYVYGDLFRALHGRCELHMISNPMPGHAQEGKRYLNNNFNVAFYEIPAELSQPQRIQRIMELCAGIRPDVITNVFAGGTKWGHAASVSAHLLGVKGIPRVSGDEITSFLMQGDFAPDSPEHKHRLALEEESFRLASKVIVMSPWEQRRVQSILEGNAPEKVEVCMRGVNFERFTYKEKRTPGVRKVSYLGRKSAEKGYFLLEEVASMLEETAPKVRFLFAGNFEPMRTGNRVYTGYIDSEQLNAYYDSIDALVLPSVTEGMPQVVCEAMAKGKPVIVPRHLFQGYLQHGKNSLLVELDTKDIAKAILMLHNDPELSTAIGLAGRDFARAHFDKTEWDKRYRQIILG